MRIAAVLSCLAIPLVYAQHDQLRLLHRLYHPAAAQAPFSERGTLFIAPNHASFQSSPSFASDLSSFAEALRTVEDRDLLLYQVALERTGDAAEAQWDISSVKVCHLSGITSEYIHLHTIDPRNPNPHALDYFVSPVPHNGACPNSGSKKSTKHAPHESPFEPLARVNTTVILKGARFPPLPQLATPPPISAQGEPIVPVPEKSFLQKYWMYIVGLILFTLLTSGGGEEEKPRK